MTADKGVFRGHHSKPDDDEALPAYEAIASQAEPVPSGGSAAPAPSSVGAPASTDCSALRDAKTAGPTADSPFQFPTGASLPPYSPPSGSPPQAGPSAPSTKLIAVPQTEPSPTAPFLPAFPPSLLRHGIVQQTFLSFLETLAAFLAAKVSDRAVAHAADVASQIGLGPKSHFKHVVGHGRDVFRGIGTHAKKGNVGGVISGLISGAVTLPITTALGLTGAVTSLPAHTISAVTKKPLTGRQRAEAYVAVANKDWFNKRGIEAALADSGDVTELLGGVELSALRDAACAEKAETKDGLLGGFGGRLEKMELSEAVEMTEAMGSFIVGPETLWLVFRRID